MALAAKGRFALVVASKREYIIRSTIIPSDFGYQVGRNLAIGEEGEDTPLFACSTTFRNDDHWQMP